LDGPAISTGFTPIRVTSAWEIVDAAMTLSAIARLPTPVLSGEKPSTSLVL